MIKGSVIGPGCHWVKKSSHAAEWRRDSNLPVSELEKRQQPSKAGELGGRRVGRAGRGQLGASQLSSPILHTGVRGGQWHGTDKPAFYPRPPGLHASAVCPHSAEKETERKQKLAVAEALLISTAGKALHWIRPRPCLPVACGPSGMRLTKASGLSSGRKGWSASRLSRTLKT